MKIIYKLKSLPEVEHPINDVVDIAFDSIGNLWVTYRFGETENMCFLDITNLAECTIYDTPKRSDQ